MWWRQFKHEHRVRWGASCKHHVRWGVSYIGCSITLELEPERIWKSCSTSCSDSTSLATTEIISQVHWHQQSATSHWHRFQLCLHPIKLPIQRETVQPALNQKWQWNISYKIVGCMKKTAVNLNSPSEREAVWRHHIPGSNSRFYKWGQSQHVLKKKNNKEQELSSCSLVKWSHSQTSLLHCFEKMTNICF